MIVWRMLGYSAALAITMLVVISVQTNSPDALRWLVPSALAPTLGTSEFSPIEWLQVVLLAITAGLAFYCSRLLYQRRSLCYLMAFVAIAALIRELDLFLDYYLIDHAWQVLVALLAVAMFVYQYRHWDALRAAWARALPSPGITLMLAAAMVLMVFANLFGHEPFWQGLLGDQYHRSAKIAAEELSEVLGYWLWTAGQIEFMLQCAYQHRLANAGERRRGERRQ